MTKLFILTHDALGRELYEPRALRITDDHANALRESGFTLQEETNEKDANHA